MIAPSPKPPPVPDVLFLDAGNTVVFLDHEAVSEVLREQGVRATPQALREAEGRAKRHYTAFLQAGGSHEDGWYALVTRMLREAGVEEGRVEDLTTRLRAVHDALNLWRKVPEGLIGALGRARDAGIRLAVISNSEGQLPRLFEAVGLGDMFEAVIDSANEGVCKPDPEIFRRALERLEVAAARACYAGDIPEVDVEGARSVGMNAVLVDPFGFYPDYARALRVSSVGELIDRWLGGPPHRSR